MQSTLIELDDILNEIENEEASVEFDPVKATEAKDRLDLLYRLLKKHRFNTVQELLSFQQELEQKAILTANLDGELEKARRNFESAEKFLLEISDKLSQSRKGVFTPLSEQLTGLLHELGMPDARLNIDHQYKSPGASGADNIELLFSANKGIMPRPLDQVASGGEFSRLMFCIKYVMAEKTSMPTLVLDEIDTGISGETAFKLGRLMKVMAGNHQLITITHLPQIAAKADTHYFVYKDNASGKTISSIRQLADDERVIEIAKMIGGENPSAIAVENARELMHN
jgi:DNA repair protein RecN (Recombination protein N)